MGKRVAALVLIMITVIGVNLGFVNRRLMSDRVRMNVIEYQSYMRDVQLFHMLGDEVPGVVENRLASVVSIHMQHATKVNSYTGEPLENCAAGVVWSEDGCIVTASHVVDDVDFSQCSRVWVRFADGTERDILRVAYANNRKPDVGLVWIDPNGLNLQAIAESDRERNPIIGEKVIVIGCPVGYDHLVTVGVVSRYQLTRDLQDMDTLFIQTDAAINGGNSGGPLFDLEGKLLGIMSWKRFAEGISFAVPIEEIEIGISQCMENVIEVHVLGM